MAALIHPNRLRPIDLSGTVVKLTHDYFAQRQAGQEPQFHGRDYPELEGKVDHDIWWRSRR